MGGVNESPLPFSRSWYSDILQKIPPSTYSIGEGMNMIRWEYVNKRKWIGCVNGRCE